MEIEGFMRSYQYILVNINEVRILKFIHLKGIVRPATTLSRFWFTVPVTFMSLPI